MRSAVLSSILLAALCSCQRRPAADRSLSAEEVADRARPATVLILSSFEATASVPALTVDSPAFVVAAHDVISDDASAATNFRAIMNVMLANPARFMVPGSDMRSKKTNFVSQGSGFIFSPDGYIATNAHVVLPDAELLKSSLIGSEKEWLASDISELEDEIQRVLPGVSIRDEAKQRLLGVIAQYYSKAGTISDLKQEVRAVMGYIGDDSEPGLACKVVKVGKPIPGKDVAILKIEGADFPTLPLAPNLDIAGVRTGSEVNVMGFPGEVTDYGRLSLASRLEPSQTNGHVSGIRTMEDGWRVVQTDAAINHGNSGGPAMDNRGQVIGLATFGLNEKQDGINFIVSVEVLHEFLADRNITASTSAFTENYIQALDYVQSGRQARALAIFQRLQQEHSGIRAVDEYVRRLSAGGVKAPGETVQRPSPVHEEGSRAAPARANRALLILGGVVLLVGAALAAIVAANRG